MKQRVVRRRKGRSGHPLRCVIFRVSPGRFTNLSRARVSTRRRASSIRIAPGTLFSLPFRGLPTRQLSGRFVCLPMPCTLAGTGQSAARLGRSRPASRGTVNNAILTMEASSSRETGRSCLSFMALSIARELTGTRPGRRAHSGRRGPAWRLRRKARKRARQRCADAMGGVPPGTGVRRKEGERPWRTHGKPRASRS